MRAILAGFCLITLVATTHTAVAADGRSALPEAAVTKGPPESLEQIDAELHRGEWTAAEAGSRALLSEALKDKGPRTFDAVARLALAEAGLGRTAEALWYWSVAQNLLVDFDPKPFGAPGELLASHALRHLDEVPPGLTLRQPGVGGEAFSAPHTLQTKKIDLPAALPAPPMGIRVQVIVDTQGQVEQPVVVQSTSAALSYVSLEALRDWRFEPARVGGTPVAAFYEFRVPAERRPLANVVEFAGTSLAEPETILRAGRYQDAGKRLEKFWEFSLTDSVPSRAFLGVTLALKALAQAGQGEADAAICRWQAAQTLEPRLYGADLSAYGPAGKLLEAHPWGEEFVGPFPEGAPELVHRAEILKRRQLVYYPEHTRGEKGQQKVVIQATITKTGVVRDPLLFSRKTLPGMEANAIDTLCDWRFKPALYKGAPFAVHYYLTVSFGPYG